MTNEAITVVESNRGIVESSQTSGTEDQARATLQLVIPTRTLDTTLDQLSDLADVKSLSEGTVDITRPFVDAKDELAGLRAERVALINQIQAADTEEELDQLRARLDALLEHDRPGRGRLRQHPAPRGPLERHPPDHLRGRRRGRLVLRRGHRRRGPRPRGRRRDRTDRGRRPAPARAGRRDHLLRDERGSQPRPRTRPRRVAPTTRRRARSRPCERRRPGRTSRRGCRSKAVPGGMPPSGSPSSGS